MDASLKYAEDHIFERVSRSRATTRSLPEALRHGRGQVDREQLKKYLAAQESSGAILRKGDEIATKESLKRERQMIDAVNVENDRVSQAYLFCGVRGTGKTSIARILAKRLNCASPQGPEPCDQCESCLAIVKGHSLDILEIDAASHTSVDDIRELRESIKYAPTGGKHKIYIIDEVHRLSPSAFDALLKTLEEPPAHAVFIFATTEVHKVPQTILSRCQRYDFKRISESELKGGTEGNCRQRRI